MNFVKGTGISLLLKLLLNLSKIQYVCLVLLMYANSVNGTLLLTHTDVLNVLREAFMIQSFKIVENNVKVLMIKFKFYQLDSLISQPQHVFQNV